MSRETQDWSAPVGVTLRLRLKNRDFIDIKAKADPFPVATRDQGGNLDGVLFEPLDEFSGFPLWVDWGYVKGIDIRPLAEYAVGKAKSSSASSGPKTPRTQCEGITRNEEQCAKKVTGRRFCAYHEEQGVEEDLQRSRLVSQRNTKLEKARDDAREWIRQSGVNPAEWKNWTNQVEVWVRQLRHDHSLAEGDAEDVWADVLGINREDQPFDEYLRMIGFYR
jgi:hypothetical protein